MALQDQSLFAPQSQRSLPNASAVLALGIISIIGCCCYGIPGIVLSIVALILYNKDIRLYKSNPEWYTPASYSNLQAGRICAIIGLIPSILFLLFLIFVLLTAGFGILSSPQDVFNWI